MLGSRGHLYWRNFDAGGQRFELCGFLWAPDAMHYIYRLSTKLAYYRPPLSTHHIKNITPASIPTSYTIIKSVLQRNRLVYRKGFMPRNWLLFTQVRLQPISQYFRQVALLLEGYFIDIVSKDRIGQTGTRAWQISAGCGTWLVSAGLGAIKKAASATDLLLNFTIE